MEGSTQPMCQGCQNINEVVRGRTQSPSTAPILLHRSFQELDICAKNCATCRVFRQGILLNQPTIDDVMSLSTNSDERLPVWVTPRLRGGNTLEVGELFVSLQATEYSPHYHTRSATIQLMRNSYELNKSTTIPTWSQAPLNSTAESITIPSVSNMGGDSRPKDPVESSLAQSSIEHIFEQVRLWAEECRGHPECGNLNWSTKNPTRLVHIISYWEVRLVNTRELNLVGYSALSYCWGGQASGMTLNGNLRRRGASLLIRDLPQTIRDAIVLTKGAGLSYIWVDSICVIQDNAEDWARESALMQEVYSNARFTICVSSAAKADAGLFRRRTAWEYPTEPCKFWIYWVSVLESPFDDVVRESPWSSRAWTLQEERLSPRLLYWTPQRMYWSCARFQMFETMPPSLLRVEANGTTAHSTQLELEEFNAPRTQSKQMQALLRADSTRLAQAFLLASRAGRGLHKHWGLLVEFYARRELTNSDDIFPAISGIAARYQRGLLRHEYLAGLWRSSFAQDLAWYCKPIPRQKQKLDKHNIPSWSWASLPLPHSVYIEGRLNMVNDKEQPLLVVARATAAGNLGEHEYVDVKQGAAITNVTVRACIRTLWSEQSVLQPWEEVRIDIDGNEKFAFANFIDQNIHCVERDRGLVLAYEAHREETVGKIDYTADADRVFDGALSISCLELGEGAMLLLEYCGMIAGDSIFEAYRRIGVSTRFAVDFFETAQVKTVVLL